MKYLKTAFTITNGSGGKAQDMSLLQTAKDVLCQLSGMAGFEAFEDNGANGITGYVQEQNFDNDALSGIIGNFPVNDVSVTYSIQKAEDRDWNEEWEKTGFEPITIGERFTVHDTLHHVPRKDGMTDITIDARQAFGTGCHDTTHMVASELLRLGLKGKRVLDCGCGTGILSIISAKAGAVSVTGYDIDEWSVANTKHNCDINNVANVETLHGDASVITSLKGEFDIVIANINRNILLNDMPMLKSAMGKDAILIISGFYEKDATMLINKAELLGLELIKSATTDDWCMLSFRAV